MNSAERHGRTAMLAGWVHVRRDHGGVIFIDLRDREGLTQVVFRPEENAEVVAQAHHLRNEDVIEVEGKVSARVPGTENPKLPTGDIELVPATLRILNRADVLPFPLDAEVSNEDLRLSYVADLRRPQMARNLRLRHKVTKRPAIFSTKKALWRSRPDSLQKHAGGARDFLVPSRLTKGKFYALPQARSNASSCSWWAGSKNIFRSRSVPRRISARIANRSLQIDIEASFVVPDDIFVLVEAYRSHVSRRARRKIATPFPRLTYAQAMDEYGSDKPDRRFDMPDGPGRYFPFEFLQNVSWSRLRWRGQSD
jgi:aspartyl-tRNA synthetase